MIATAVSRNTTDPKPGPPAIKARAAGGIVVAIDGSPGSMAALVPAFALASARKCAIQVVSVIPPFASYRYGTEIDESESQIESLRVNIRDVAVRKIIEKVSPSCDWSHEIITGRVAREVVLAAERRNAELIVVGRRAQNPLDRLLGGETTLDIVRMTSIPVLVAGPTPFPPKTVAAATDFSGTSTEAARLAVQFLGGHGTIYLVHVDPGAEPELEQYRLPERRHSPGDFSQLFDRQREAIHPPAGIDVECVTLCGTPAERIAEFAQSVSADLITCGPHGHSGLERFLLGSVSTSIIRNAKCGVLVAPTDTLRRPSR